MQIKKANSHCEFAHQIFLLQPPKFVKRDFLQIFVSISKFSQPKFILMIGNLTVVGLVDLYSGDRSKIFILWKVSWGQYKNKLLI